MVLSHLLGLRELEGGAGFGFGPSTGDCADDRVDRQTQEGRSIFVLVRRRMVMLRPDFEWCKTPKLPSMVQSVLRFRCEGLRVSLSLSLCLSPSLSLSLLRA